MVTEKKKVLFVTGTRADFGKLKLLIRAVSESPKHDYFIFATGMHTLVRYDYTYKEIANSGFENVFLYHNQSKYSENSGDQILAKTIEGLSNFVGEYGPDMIVVHGDRSEALAGAIVGVLNEILVSHIEGGEVSGTIDEVLRHSISKLADYHFVSNQEAALRLKQMGEKNESIVVMGSPEVDMMVSDELPCLDEAKRRYDIPYDKYAVFCFHGC